jgi:hypothetical protein
MKKIKLSVAGQEVVCNFGVNYFYKHFYEITGTDMLVDGLKELASVKMFSLVPAIYCAGYFAECSLKKEEPKISKADFESHILSMDEKGAADMLNDYLNAINPKEETKEGEEIAQTVNP